MFRSTRLSALLVVALGAACQGLIPAPRAVLSAVRTAAGARIAPVAVLAAIILTLLPELFREFSEYRMIVYALALIIVMIVRPQGLLGIKELWELSSWRKLGARLGRIGGKS